MKLTCLNIEYTVLLLKRTFFIINLLVPFYNFGQDGEISSGITSDRYTFVLNDTYILAGFNLSGIYYSNNFRSLGYIPGFMIGAEQYFPSRAKFFTSTGVHFTNRPFRHRAGNKPVNFNNLYIDVPLSFSYEIPYLRKFDFRLILGAFASVRLGSWQSTSYSTEYLNQENNYIYDTNQFNRMDFGWVFGTSLEYKNYIARIRGITGFNNIDRNDQGMINSFNLEFGYFFLRNKNY